MHTTTRIALSIPLLAAPAPAQELNLEEHLIATLPDGVELEGEPIKGPDGEEWPNVNSVVWSPDGTQIAYVGLVDGKSHPVIGEDVGDEYDFANAPVFGRTGADVAFRVGNRKSISEERWWVLLADQRIGKENWIGALVWSQDGERLAWWTQPDAKIGRDGAYEGGDHVLVIATRKKDKWKLKKGDDWKDAYTVRPPHFDAKGRAISLASKRDLWYVISFDGRKEREISRGQSWVSDFAVSPDGEEVAYVAIDLDGWTGTGGSIPTLIFHERERYGRGYDASSRPVFSPKNKHIAFQITRKGLAGIAVDDEEEAETSFDGVSLAVFRPDGKRLAFVGREGAGSGPFTGPFGSEANEGKAHATLVLRDSKAGARIEPGAEFDQIEHLIWSPDGTQLAMCAEQEGKWRLIVGDRRSEPFDELGRPQFSADGAHIAFGARDGRELWWKVMALGGE